MTEIIALYFVPALPIATRSFLCLSWYTAALEDLPEEAQARDQSRSTILTLAGFSFTALVAIVLLEPNARKAMQLPTWCVVASFVGFFAATNLQSYKATVWQNQLSWALVECGSLSLTLAVITLVWSTEFPLDMKWATAILAFGAWMVDHTIRLFLDWQILKAPEQETGDAIR